MMLVHKFKYAEYLRITVWWEVPSLNQSIQQDERQLQSSSSETP